MGVIFNQNSARRIARAVKRVESDYSNPQRRSFHLPDSGDVRLMFDLGKLTATSVFVRAGQWDRLAGGTDNQIKLGVYPGVLGGAPSSPSDVSDDIDDYRILDGFPSGTTSFVYIQLSDPDSPVTLSASHAASQPVDITNIVRTLGTVTTDADGNITDVTQWWDGGIIRDALGGSSPDLSSINLNSDGELQWWNWEDPSSDIITSDNLDWDSDLFGVWQSGAANLQYITAADIVRGALVGADSMWWSTVTWKGAIDWTSATNPPHSGLSDIVAGSGTDDHDGAAVGWYSGSGNFPYVTAVSGDRAGNYFDTAAYLFDHDGKDSICPDGRGLYDAAEQLVLDWGTNLLAYGWESSGVFDVSNATAATSTTDGALTVAGGVGIAGDAWAGSWNLDATNTWDTSKLDVSVSGDVTVDAANITLTAAAGGVTNIAGPELQYNGVKGETIPGWFGYGGFIGTPGSGSGEINKVEGLYLLDAMGTYFGPFNFLVEMP